MFNKNKPVEKVVLKDKVVEFPLSIEMRLPDLTQMGYQRPEIMALFEELEKQSFGIYSRGNRGKANCAHFEFFKDFPPTFSMTFKVQKLHENYVGKPVVKQKSNNQIQQQYKANPASPGISKTSLTSTKYVILIVDDVMSVKLADEGADSVELALDKVWNQIKDRVSEPHYQCMTLKEAVSSKLMGLGIYNLK